MSQVAFLIVFLLAFGERKNVSTLRASDLDVWHVTVSMSGTEVSPLSLRGASESSFRFHWLSERIRKSDNAQILPTVLASETVKLGEFTPPECLVQTLI